MNENKKINVKFKDKENNLAKLQIEITHRNGYLEFSMSGEYNNGMGQCLDSIRPADNNQKRLIEIWKKYHLNGMNAGTPKQTKKLQEIEYESYDNACLFLDSFDATGKPITAFDLEKIHKAKEKVKTKISDKQKEISILTKKQEEMKVDGLTNDCWIVIKDLNIKEFSGHSFGAVRKFFDKQSKIKNVELFDLNKLLEQINKKTLLYDYGTDKILYKYGATWHKTDLPKDLWEEVLKLKINIEKIEESKKVKGGNWEDITDYKIVALGKHLKLEPKEAETDIKGTQDGVYSYCGIDYYVLTKDEAQNKTEEYLGDELW